MAFKTFLQLFLLTSSGTVAFISTIPPTPHQAATLGEKSREAPILFLGRHDEQQERSDGTTVTSSRRSFFATVASPLLVATAITSSSSPVSAAQAIEERQGIEVTPFNGLIFNYRNSQFGGLDASDLNEPSVSYQEFCARLTKGEVSFVEFIAPDGDVAYVTFKAAAEGEAAAPAPIRIGEGYPIEQHDGWSSPAFAVRTVKNAGVPYRFTVPGLAKYSSN